MAAVRSLPPQSDGGVLAVLLALLALICYCTYACLASELQASQTTRNDSFLYDKSEQFRVEHQLDVQLQVQLEVERELIVQLYIQLHTL